VKYIRRPILYVLALFALSIFAVPAFAQADGPVIRDPRSSDQKDPESNSIQEMAVKQQISRRKKEHEELLKQGDEALKLADELETSFDKNQSFSNGDLQKLQELEKLASKIRQELGGSDEDDNPELSADSDENQARSSFSTAFAFLRDSTVKLVDELKKSTRFSISVAAIQASNSVVKFARFLRLKK
jgi:hypothetical protein